MFYNAFAIAPDGPPTGERGLKIGSKHKTAPEQKHLRINHFESPIVSKKTALSVLRVVLLDIPLVALLVLYAATVVALYCNEHYFQPQVNELLPWRKRLDRKKSEITYYGRVCTEADQTAYSPEEITITPDMTTDDAVDSMLLHGISIFPDLIHPQTAQALRDTIIEHNTIEDHFYVLRPNNRHSYGIRVEQHPAVRQAIHEITTNPVLQPAMKKIIGDHQAVYKFHSITSDYGAADQDFHWDVIPQNSAAMYARSFAPIYSLFIPLQNTTADMGSTEICPGSHICTAGTSFCRKTAFRASGEADNWPAGTGALMNQQMTHRGRAHVDPDAGPRVLFILAFTPRPRYDHDHELETRGLSLGGSYAVHWTQWGHTEWDLQDSWNRMKQPWKLLRSIGLYKPKQAFWGWDWITSVLIQVANGDYFRRDQLAEFIEDDGFAPIPRHLWPDMPDEKFKRGWVWLEYAYALTVNCKAYLQKLITTALIIYVSGALAWNGFRFSKSQVTGGEVAKSSLFVFVRVLFLVAVVYAPYRYVTQRIDSTPWARHIRIGKLYQLSHDFRGPLLPSVLPLEQDVLLMDDMQSEYLASYTRLHDIAHPGNAVWKEMVSLNAGGYGGLNESLQTQLRQSLYLWNFQKQSRMLIKNNLNQWAEMTYDIADEFMHKQLMRRDISIIDHILRYLDYLLSETKFGPWRDTRLHRTHIPELLCSLEQRILRVSDTNEKPTGLPVEPMSPAFRVSPYLARVPTASLSVKSVSGRCSGIPPSETNITEPFIGAWLQVGDEVEGRYHKTFNEWYRGSILYANGYDATWTVLYDGGETDIQLCRYCVRPFKEYQVGDVVEYKMNEEDDYHEARIAVVKDDGSYDFVHLASDDEVRARYGIRPNDMRRFKPTLAQGGRFVLGQQVEARWFDEYDEHDGEWHLGYIVAITEDEERTTYNIEYSDRTHQELIWEEDLRAL